MAGFKLKVVDYALEHGNRAAGRHFGVAEVRVRYWRKQHDKLRATNRERRAFRGPKTGKFPKRSYSMSGTYERKAASCPMK